MAFEQAAIKVEKERSLRLKAAIERAFLPEKVEKLLKRLDRKEFAIRDL